MFSNAQTLRLQKIIKHKYGGRSIKDLVLLTEATRQYHPSVLRLYSQPVAKFPRFPRQSIASSCNIQMYVTPLNGYYYMGLYGENLEGNYIQGTLADLLQSVNHARKVEIVKECLLQICILLNNLNAEKLNYVHGDLDASNIVYIPGKYFIVDKGFRKCGGLADVFSHYRSANVDLCTLCLSLAQFFDEPCLELPELFEPLQHFHSLNPILNPIVRLFNPKISTVFEKYREIISNVHTTYMFEPKIFLQQYFKNKHLSFVEKTNLHKSVFKRNK